MPVTQLGALLAALAIAETWLCWRVGFEQLTEKERDKPVNAISRALVRSIQVCVMRLPRADLALLVEDLKLAGFLSQDFVLPPSPYSREAAAIE